jgi:hypothetical protein
MHPSATKAHFRISVEAETSWLYAGEWTRSEMLQMTTRGSRGVDLVREKAKLFARFLLEAPPFDMLRPTSRYILRRKPLIAIDPTSISRCLKGFAASCRKIPIPRNYETQFLSDLCEAIRPRYTWNSVHSIQELTGYLKGDLALTVMPHRRGDPFPVCLDRNSGAMVSVLKACYLSPYAEALLTRNPERLDGLLMDATWKIIRGCVSSILMLSFCNVGIPIALAIGPKEDKALDEIFYATIFERFGIHIESYPVVSDQGTALRAVCAEHAHPQFFCLRHFLVSLKCKLWSNEIGNLIRCRVHHDFRNLCRQYEPRFAEALRDPGSARAKRLGKVLQTVGLAMSADGIVVSEQSKWASISMMERVSTRLPSTSNALESFHGHGNAQTPRRNDFLPSMVRVSAMMIRKTLSFRAALENSFRLVMRKARRRAKLMDPAILASEAAQYATSREHCDGGETSQLSAMYRMSCPCRHQYSIGAEKPRLLGVDAGDASGSFGAGRGWFSLRRAANALGRSCRAADSEVLAFKEDERNQGICSRTF